MKNLNRIKKLEDEKNKSVFSLVIGILNDDGTVECKKENKIYKDKKSFQSAYEDTLIMRFF